ncbi:hypothetical protein LS68_000595 [Helicobacter sp. MIT 05-5293]|uniref:hypothetical protein n=1 Tax=Helicobacter sp. MIT 05-5293 TaxID=1548149 RepID=UPI00051CD5DE|nr:hypothetical protein [Helicobacter sp. MIT 05-5293]TLD81568.1 hypothetical protein LS68_000595 [Helicobacter sp. MIT 05-5293]
MPYFGGFGLKGESALFKEILQDDMTNPYVAVGFDVGCVEALSYVQDCIRFKHRVQKLILLSPLFCPLLDSVDYENVQSYWALGVQPTHHFDTIKPYVQNHTPMLTKQHALFLFEWEKEMFDSLKKNGIEINVYLGGIDPLIESTEALDFFKAFASVWIYRHFAHLLC